MVANINWFIIGFLAATVIYFIVHWIYRSIKEKNASMPKIKTYEIGNKFFNIRTVEEIKLPIWEIYRLDRQVDDLKETVDKIVDRITLYQMEDFYNMDDIVQRNIDAFCDNFKELGIVCSRCKQGHISTSILDDAVNEVWKDNAIILERLHDFLKMLDNYLIYHKECLVKMHSGEIEFDLEKYTKIKETKLELESEEKSSDLLP